MVFDCPDPVNENILDMHGYVSKNGKRTTVKKDLEYKKK